MNSLFGETNDFLHTGEVKGPLATTFHGFRVPCFSLSLLFGGFFPTASAVTGDRRHNTPGKKKKKDPRSLIAMATSAYLPPLRLSLWVGCTVQDYSGLNCDIYLRRSLKEHLGRHFQPKRSIGKCVYVWRGKAAVLSYNNFAMHEWGTKNMQYY